MQKIGLFLLLLIATLGLNAQVRPTVAVLGDSYSTFEGFIPKGHPEWYRTNVNKAATDVDKVEQTWWWQVVKNGGYKLGVNDSYSGSTVCFTGYDDADFSDRSFVTRATNLGTPDIILVCGGTNDSWCGAKVGEYKYEGWKRADMYYFRPALAKLYTVLREHYPNVEIYFILNDCLRDDINESVDVISKHYGVPVIKLSGIDKQNGHPNVKGMKTFADQVLSALKKK
ncbi:MAG: SGNH/GDSL hydrolase family protein [Sodaliphilus sp.]|jgi:hypothetical protein|nr:SGNH/GDSL hydrolase family protein [Sodaliphilus sp.]